MSQDNENNIGEIVIEDQVIAEYVSDEVLKFDDVSRFIGGITETFSKNILGREPAASGIKIQREENSVTINVHIIVFYGVNIPQLSYDIQMSIKKALEDYTGLKVKAVNVAVEGIDRSKVNE